MLLKRIILLSFLYCFTTICSFAAIEKSADLPRMEVPWFYQGFTIEVNESVAQVLSGLVACGAASVIYKPEVFGVLSEIVFSGARPLSYVVTVGTAYLLALRAFYSRTLTGMYTDALAHYEAAVINISKDLYFSAIEDELSAVAYARSSFAHDDFPLHSASIVIKKMMDELQQASSLLATFFAKASQLGDSSSDVYKAASKLAVVIKSQQESIAKKSILLVTSSAYEKEIDKLAIQDGKKREDKERQKDRDLALVVNGAYAVKHNHTVEEKRNASFV